MCESMDGSEDWPRKPQLRRIIRELGMTVCEYDGILIRIRIGEITGSNHETWS